MRVDVWSDIVCPWCAIGRHRLRQAAASVGIPIEVVPHAFQLDPTHGPPRPSVERLAERYGGLERARAMTQRVRELAQREGLLLRTDEAISVNTFDAHRLVAWAEATAGRGEAVAEALAAAHFEALEDVSRHDVLQRVAGQAGLDAQAAGAMLAGDAYAEAVRRDEAQAAELGIRGVPFFVLDGRLAVSGAQDALVFADALRQANGAAA